MPLSSKGDEQHTCRCDLLQRKSGCVRRRWRLRPEGLTLIAFARGKTPCPAIWARVWVYSRDLTFPTKFASRSDGRAACRLIEWWSALGLHGVAGADGAMRKRPTWRAWCERDSVDAGSPQGSQPAGAASTLVAQE